MAITSANKTKYTISSASVVITSTTNYWQQHLPIIYRNNISLCQLMRLTSTSNKRWNDISHMAITSAISNMCQYNGITTSIKQYHRHKHFLIHLGVYIKLWISTFLRLEKAWLGARWKLVSKHKIWFCSREKQILHYVKQNEKYPYEIFPCFSDGIRKRRRLGSHFNPDHGNVFHASSRPPVKWR